MEAREDVDGVAARSIGDPKNVRHYQSDAAEEIRREMVALMRAYR